MKIKKGDQVVVVTGKNKSATPRTVQQVLAGGESVIIEGVNVVLKHVKRGHPKSPQGGRLSLEKPIHSSNIMFYCSTCSAPTRLGYRYLANGSKERFCRKCSTSVGQISPPRPAYANS